MKLKKRFFLLWLAFLVVLSGCGAKETADSNKDENTDIRNEVVQKEEADPEKLEAEEFIAKYADTDERPIAVMVDNDDDNARPQAGLNEAYLIYEMLIEGGSTRFMAFFRNEDTEQIGPVRSSRHYYLDYVMENDAIYTHYGWSPKAMQDISSFKINKINGILGGDDKIFWRERKYKGDWHSAYTSIEKIKEMAEKKEYRMETDHKGGIEYSDSYIVPDGDKTAEEVILNYSKKYTTGYVYNGEKKLYEKTIKGKPHLMKNGECVEVKNIIVQLISDTSLGDGSDRRNIDTTGEGKGYYITSGKYEEITWSKSSRKDNTEYKKADGTPLYINPGKTIVNIISPSLISIK